MKRMNIQPYMGEMGDYTPSRETLTAVESIAFKLKGFDRRTAKGELELQNSINLAAISFEALKKNPTHASLIMVALLQSGKTGALIIFIACLTVFWEDGEKIGASLTCNISNTALFNQLQKKFRKAGFYAWGRPLSIENRSFHNLLRFDNVVNGRTISVFLGIVMLSGGALRVKDTDTYKVVTGKLKDLHDLQVAVGCTKFAHIMDEVQVAIGNDSMMSKFLEEVLGTRSASADQSIFEPQTIFVGSTATPGRHFILPTFHHSPLMVFGRPGKGYIGLKDLYKAGRLVNFPQKPKVEDIKQVLLPLLKKDPKYFIFRVLNSKVKLPVIQQACEELGILIKEYSSAKQNILELTGEPDTEDLGYRGVLADKPEQHTVIYIKGAFLAGVVLHTVENIGAWFELAYNSPEAAVQSIGRNCGYAKDRHEATFKIYCDISHIEYQLKVDQAAEEGNPQIFSYAERANKKPRSVKFARGVRSTPRVMRYGDYKRLQDDYAKIDPSVRHSEVGNMAENENTNIALDVLNGGLHIKSTGFIIPGRSKNPEHHATWERLIATPGFEALKGIEPKSKKDLTDDDLVIAFGELGLTEDDVPAARNIYAGGEPKIKWVAKDGTAVFAFGPRSQARAHFKRLGIKPQKEENSIYDNGAKDLAQEIWNGTFGQEKTRFIKNDGPSKNLKYAASHEKLLKKFPEAADPKKSNWVWYPTNLIPESEQQAPLSKTIFAGKE